jgi:4-hydroxy-4-methyl-2-oxoglutarate aldolase
MSEHGELADLMWELRRWDTPTLCNAVEQLGIRDRTLGFLGLRIRCLFPEMGPMVGFALTARFDCTTPGPPPETHVVDLLSALDRAPHPTVIVMQNESSDANRGCAFGEVMATASRALGAVGLVTDGGVRDVAEVRQLGFHYFAVGTVPAHGNFQLRAIGEPVELEGQRIAPGDVIHADRNGVAIFPADCVGELVQAAERVRRVEAEIMKAASRTDGDRLSAIQVAMRRVDG